MRPGALVALAGLDDPGFERLLGARAREISRGRPRPGSDLIFLYAASPVELAGIASLKRFLKPDGALWVVRPKGPGAGLTEVDVIEAALRAGLVDNKVVSFSESLSALRLVFRLRDRATMAGGPGGKGRSHRGTVR
ncbi:MAG TPA: hypothetical protein VK131_10230 [Candidatus Acidoferrales bacterium]|nr:hypothetical protein [Candidatus Acidoferrales bacterium]